MMKKIYKYETDDGKEFDTQEEAKAHEKEIDFSHWYSSGNVIEILKHGDNEIGYSQLSAWLRSHKEKVLEILGVRTRKKKE